MTIQAEPTRGRRRADELPGKTTATKTAGTAARSATKTSVKKETAARSATKTSVKKGTAARSATKTSVKKGTAASVATKVAKAATAPVEAPPRPSRSRSAAAQRAYARRAHREGRKVERVVESDSDRAAGRASFVVLIIAVLAVGVAATLWLSTQAIADSYRLDDAKKEAEQLAEQAAQLQREVTEQESAASLAERAKAMGMVPAGDPARLVVQPDGTVVLVGEPTPVQGPPPATSTAGQPPANQQQQTGANPGAGG